MKEATTEELAKFDIDKQQYIVKRIEELKQELSTYLATVKNEVPPGKKISRHAVKKRDISRRITNLLKTGYESPAQNPVSQEKKRQTNMRIYGYPQGNVKAINAACVQNKTGWHSEEAQAKRNAKMPQTTAKMLETAKANGSYIGRGKKIADAKRDRGTLSDNMRKVNESRKRKWGPTGYDVTKHEANIIAEYGSLERYHKLRALKAAASHDYKKDVENRRRKFNGKGQNVDKMHETCKAKYNYDWPCQLPQCTTTGKRLSNTNKAFKEKVEVLLNIQLEVEYTIEDKSFDLAYIVKDANGEVDKQRSILIELNPTVTHNCTYSYSQLSGRNMNVQPIDSMHHVRKQQLAIQHGFRCIQIFDWDDKNKVVELLRRMIDTDYKVIYARKCVIKQIEQKVAKQFQDTYHLQGHLHSQPICFGLYCNDELVQVMTFGKTRHGIKANKDAYELLRLCTANCVVVGGAEKLFAHFVKTYQPTTIVSYCDLSKFTGKVYEILGFELVHIAPSMRYVNLGWKEFRHLPYVISASLLRMRGADALIGTNYGKGTNNHDIMIKHGYAVVYDCGQATWVWHA